ncbi:hypothetical protein WJX81_001243 [Elliptochloris bilobata]|uniref:Fungal lipase-type domain-containing protein n=1 Tax=Elliptochloris bilobata TaxID=381761 RepID=A0AAW1RCV8_9CHLO
MAAGTVDFVFEKAPEPVLHVEREYSKVATAEQCPNSNFLKGVKWSPDGACLLTASDDCWLRVFDLPADALERPSLEVGCAGGDGASASSDAGDPADSAAPALRVFEGETVYDYAWYPGMHASDPSSCVFASTSRAHPLRLWDAVTGGVRGSYRAYDAVDEVVAATSVAFSACGGRLLAGYNRCMRIWDVARPGRDYREIVTHRRRQDGLSGIVSCLAPNPDRSGLLAAGSYSGAAALFDENSGELLFLLAGHVGGVTQVAFSRDGNYLYTGARRDPDILCWDVRAASGVVYRLPRASGTTNQRIAFDIEPCGRHLVTGGENGCMRVFDLATGEPKASFPAAGDTLNGAHFHPSLPLLATASGHRRYPLAPSDSDSDAENGKPAFAGHGAQNALLVWRFQPETQRAADVVADAVEQAAAVDAAETKAKIKAPPADIRRYLKATGLIELRYIRKLSSLCAQTYYIKKLTEHSVLRRYKLKLVTTSLECAHVTADVPRTPAEAINEADAMATCPLQVEAASSEGASPDEGDAALTIEAEPQKTDLAAKDAKGPSPADLVAGRLAAAASAAAAAAAPLANNLSSVAAAAAGTVPMKAVTSQLQTAAAAGHSTAVATLATVTAAMQSTWDPERGKKAARANPTEWYVVDDAATTTRFFIIQGSDTLDHWRVNLTFDPVAFEDPSLGVKVHRGVYETAQVLYRRFLPLVQEHVAASPFAKVVFTGHSLGGSLGTLLMLMFLRRGILPPVALSPSYTFGAPAVFCEGTEPGMCGLNGQSGPTLLERLGLPSSAVRNVVMHNDIVPRAFACDYTLVANLLAHVGEGFRGHACLQNPNGRKVMYYFLGRVIVLQPDPEVSFVRGEPGHVMLPLGPGLYTLAEPSLLAAAASAAAGQLPAPPAVPMGAFTPMGANNISPKPAAVGRRDGAAAPSAASAAANPAGADSPVAVPAALGPPAPSLLDAVMELLDYPHPLETLREPASYGDEGTISRYHNPDNYTKALGTVEG